MKPYADAYEMETKQHDREMWMWFGSYGLSAVAVAVEHCLAGRKAHSKYIEKPITEQHSQNASQMTEEELQRQRELFVAKLELMKTNFEISHQDSTVS